MGLLLLLLVLPKSSVPPATGPDVFTCPPWLCFVCADCVEDQYLFGRDSKCNYVLDDPDNRGSRKFQIYSKKHFKIYRVSHLHF